MSNANTLNNINEDGLITTYVQSIMNAALNIQAYVKHGIIVDGKVTDYWPKRKRGKLRGHNLLVRGEVRFRHEVEQDIAYFADGMCQSDLDDMGIHMSADKMLEHALACDVRSIALCEELKPGRKKGDPWKKVAI